MIGGTVMQTFILMWVTFRTDWNKEVIININELASKIILLQKFFWS